MRKRLVLPSHPITPFKWEEGREDGQLQWVLMPIISHAVLWRNSTVNCSLASRLNACIPDVAILMGTVNIKQATIWFELKKKKFYSKKNVLS
jgi:hypothetical protein